MNRVSGFLATLALVVPLSAHAEDPLDEPLPLATSAVAGVGYSRAFDPSPPASESCRHHPENDAPSASAPKTKATASRSLVLG
jgi:hypothetical protein